MWVAAVPCYDQACWKYLPLSLQLVSGCHTLPCFKLPENICLCLQGVSGAVPCCVLGQLITPTCLFRMWVAAAACYFKPTDNTCCHLISLWVAALPCCALSLLIMSVPISTGSEWLSNLAMFQACWWHLFSSLQHVSGCHSLLCFKPADNSCSCLSSLWVGYLTSLYFKPANNAHSWLCRGWVAFMPCSVSGLPMMPVLVSLDGEWLPWLAAFQTRWWCLLLAFQEVSGCYASQCFNPADDTYPCLSSLWVTTVPYCMSSLVIKPVLVSPASEWLLYLAVFQVG